MLIYINSLQTMFFILQQANLQYNGFFNQLLLDYSLILFSTEMKKYENYLTDTMNTGPRIPMLPKHQVLQSSPFTSCLRLSGNSIPYNEMTSFCGARKGKKC